MLKEFFRVLLGRGSNRPSPRNAWREPPLKTIREEIGAGVIAEISYPTGHHGFVNVVGELSYQDTLRDLPELFTAKLVAEPSNPHDSNAVAVMTDDDRVVGYLERGVAKSYHPRLLRLEQPVTCPAKLTGGRAHKTHIGVVLDFEEVRKTLGLPLMAVDRGPMDHNAAAEYHRINNAGRRLVKATRPLERTNLSEAEAQYRRALAMIQDCHALAAARGLIPHGFLPNQTDIVALERLVLCLIKLGRVQDARSEIEAYCTTFPHVREMKLVAIMSARVEKASTQ